MPNLRSQGYVAQPKLKCCYNCKHCHDYNSDGVFTCWNETPVYPNVEPTGICNYFMGDKTC